MRRQVEGLELLVSLRTPRAPRGPVLLGTPQSCFQEELSGAEIGFGCSLLSGTEAWMAVSVETKVPVWIPEGCPPDRVGWPSVFCQRSAGF